MNAKKTKKKPGKPKRARVRSTSPSEPISACHHCGSSDEPLIRGDDPPVHQVCAATHWDAIGDLTRSWRLGMQEARGGIIVQPRVEHQAKLYEIAGDLCPKGAEPHAWLKATAYEFGRLDKTGHIQSYLKWLQAKFGPKRLDPKTVYRPRYKFEDWEVLG